VLGELEATIMKAVWELGKGDVKSIHTCVNLEKKCALTTIATILDILHTKGLVERELLRSPSLKYEYRPALTRKEFESTVVRDVFRGLFETFGESTISYLLSGTDIRDNEKIAEFRRVLEKIKDEVKTD
jgi:predicted transcriptional regulator